MPKNLLLNEEQLKRIEWALIRNSEDYSNPNDPNRVEIDSLFNYIRKTSDRVETEEDEESSPTKCSVVIDDIENLRTTISNIKFCLEDILNGSLFYVDKYGE